eukprot:TRINITY_DN4266_c0_g1_i2.p1 TRINITY_DN4266_c0_g1~~TRINITY_DN4266_c0_g1_i2.p1  ORF type:complete len:297 (+),score=97.83 TRINITY_DN4266_c0_g1_i2:198-1088(+)
MSYRVLPRSDAALGSAAPSHLALAMPHRDDAREIQVELEKDAQGMLERLRLLDMVDRPSASSELLEAEEALHQAKATGLCRVVDPSEWVHCVSPVAPSGATEEDISLAALREQQRVRKEVLEATYLAEHRRMKLARSDDAKVRVELAQVRLRLRRLMTESTRYARFIERKVSDQARRKACVNYLQLWKRSLSPEELKAALPDGFSNKALAAAFKALPTAEQARFVEEAKALRNAADTPKQKVKATEYGRFLQKHSPAVREKLQKAHPELPNFETQKLVVKRVAAMWREAQAEKTHR